MEILEIRAPLNEDSIRGISTLFEKVFGHPPSTDFGQRLNEKRKLIALIAKERNQPAGFKIGYERSRETFFSWLGGVIPERRKRGIARMLMAKQHELCLSLGYEEIQTETYGDDPAMLILNLKEGFAVIGTHLGGDNRLRVQLRKKL